MVNKTCSMKNDYMNKNQFSCAKRGRVNHINDC